MVVRAAANSKTLPSVWDEAQDVASATAAYSKELGLVDFGPDIAVRLLKAISSTALKNIVGVMRKTLTVIMVMQGGL